MMSSLTIRDIALIESVGDGRKLLLKIGLFYTAMGIKDIHCHAPPRPMYNTKMVTLSCTGVLYSTERKYIPKRHLSTTFSLTFHGH
jgi:hypothetical protein